MKFLFLFFPIFFCSLLSHTFALQGGSGSFCVPLVPPSLPLPLLSEAQLAVSMRVALRCFSVSDLQTETFTSPAELSL